MRLSSILITLMALVGLLGLVSTTMAQPASGPFKIGIVNVAKVNQNCNLVTSKNAELGAWAQQQDNLISELSNKFGYLSEDNFIEIIDILQTPRPLPAAKAKRERELRELNDQKESRQLELQAKVNRTPAEQDEFNSLRELTESRARQIQALTEQMTAQFRQKRTEMQIQLQAALQEAIKAVAAENSYNFIFDSDVVMFGGEDLTEIVLRKLNGVATGTPGGSTPIAPPTTPITPPTSGTVTPGTTPPATTPPANGN